MKDVIKINLKKWYSLIKEYRKDIRVILDISLIVATIFLIHATYSIGNIETTLMKERFKEEINKHIKLADNLLVELKVNNNTLNMLNDIEKLKNSTESARIFISKDYALQASEEPLFGTKVIKEGLIYILGGINGLEDDINEIKIASTRDTKIKVQRIDSAIRIKKNLLQEINVMIKLVEDYKKDDEDKLRNLDEELFNDLLKR